MLETSPYCQVMQLIVKNKTLYFTSVFYSDITLCCINILTILANCFASGFVIYRYYQTRYRQPVSNALLFILASSNFLKGILVHPLFISEFILRFLGTYNCVLRSITETILCIFLGFSFLMATFVLTSERLFAVVCPIRHRVYIQKTMLYYLSLSLFIPWAILLIFLHLIVPRITELYYMYAFLISIGLLYTFMVYLKIFFVSRRKVTSRVLDKSLSMDSSSQNVSAENGTNISGLSHANPNEKKGGKVSGRNSGNVWCIKLLFVLECSQ